MDLHGGHDVAAGWLRGARAAGRAFPANRVGERRFSHCHHGEAGAVQFLGDEDECGGIVQRLLVAGHHHHLARAIFHGDGSIVRAGGDEAGPAPDPGEPGGGTVQHLSDFVFRPTGLDPGGRGGVRAPVAGRSVSRGTRRDAPCLVRSLDCFSENVSGCNRCCGSQTRSPKGASARRSSQPHRSFRILLLGIGLARGRVTARRAQGPAR